MLTVIYYLSHIQYMVDLMLPFLLQNHYNYHQGLQIRVGNQKRLIKELDFNICKSLSKFAFNFNY
ncbi:hypothetical protein BpHYR1_032472 [Brachionus plicatilis]|uniref:Uncharacterized protein n=1 Tax=Brachionus plicatilis TaxID=10195 RepID=A0A3M7T9R0_BRAPC|nr:hypothetical protein BpHYR1_032472 [Brachionus plicatilis]